MKNKTITAFFVLTICTGFANAQFLAVGTDSASEGIYIYDVNNITGSPINVNIGVNVWGMAADNANQLLYINDGSTLSSFDFVTFTNQNNITITDGNGSNIEIQSLSFNQQSGKLYGTTSVAPEAVFEINTTTGVATQVFAYVASDFDFGGTDIDPLTGKMYGVNDDASPQRGLYEIDYINSTTTFITAYQSGISFEGLAVGYGKAYLIGDDSFDNIQIYNFLTSSYETPIDTPWTGSNTLAAGTLFDPVPEPATMVGIGTLALLAIRRRRKQK